MSGNNNQYGYDSNQQSNQNQPYYQQQYQQTPAPQQQAPPAQWPPMRVGEWIVAMLLMCIPIANIILMFMWAFGSNVNPSKKSYFQATLIIAAISFLFSILISILFAAALASVFSDLLYYF